MAHVERLNLTTSPFVVLVLVFLVVATGCDIVKLKAVSDQPFPCEDQAWQSARENPNRFIAHTGGQVDGHRYTNAREALDLAYENGLRLFEIDLIETVDGYLVAAHDWDTWRQSTGSVTTHPSHEQFKEALLLGRYHALDIADLDLWFSQRPDAYLVTDKTKDFKKLLAGFSHTSRLIVEVFSVDDYRLAVAEGVRYPMLSLRTALAKDGEDKVLGLFRTLPVKFVAVSTKIVPEHEALLIKLRRNKTCVYAFTSSDPDYLRTHFEGIIYGAYTDDWNIHSGTCNGPLCDTY